MRIFGNQMDISHSLTRFVEHSPSDAMPEIASQLLDLIESDEVETIGARGRATPAEELAEKLETRLEKVKERSSVNAEDLALIEDAVAHLRANEDALVSSMTFEDSEGTRWFVLTNNEGDIVACYTSRPFVEADI